MAIVILEYNESARRDVKATWLPEKAGDPVRVATARCSEGDTFSLAEGARICCERLCGNDPFPDKLKVGDVVLLQRPIRNIIGPVRKITIDHMVEVQDSSPMSTLSYWVPEGDVIRLKKPETFSKGDQVIVAYPTYGADIRSGDRVTVSWKSTKYNLLFVMDKTGEGYGIRPDSVLVEATK